MIAERALYGAIAESSHAEVVAVAAASGAVPDHVAHLDVGSYDDLISDERVEAVYIPLPNNLHRRWATAAMQAGKHVLCEKPLGLDATETTEMFQIAADAGVLLAEAWMTPFDPRWSAVIDMVRDGAIGDLQSIQASFTFTIGPDGAANYRWNPEKGGGALADVGVYCLGAVEALWGHHPVNIDTSIEWSAVQEGASGPVDATTASELHWADGRRASIRCSFVEDEQQRLELVGTTGTILLEDNAFTGGAAATDALVQRDGQTTTVSVEPANLYRRMVDAFALAARGVEPWPRSSDNTIAMLALLDEIASRGSE